MPSGEHKLALPWMAQKMVKQWLDLCCCSLGQKGSYVRSNAQKGVPTVSAPLVPCGARGRRWHENGIRYVSVGPCVTPRQNFIEGKQSRQYGLPSIVRDSNLYRYLGPAKHMLIPNYYSTFTHFLHRFFWLLCCFVQNKAPFT